MFSDILKIFFFFQKSLEVFFYLFRRNAANDVINPLDNPIETIIFYERFALFGSENFVKISVKAISVIRAVICA